MDIIIVLKNVALGDDGYAEVVRLNLLARVGSFVSSASNAWDVVGALLRQNVTIGAAQVAFASLDRTIPLTEVGRGLRSVWYNQYHGGLPPIMDMTWVVFIIEGRSIEPKGGLNYGYCRLCCWIGCCSFYCY